MVRKWLIRCMVLLATASLGAQAFALGLGEITVNSALNERFSAEIEILDSSGLSPEEILVSLARAEDFERVGVERFFYLTNLRFEVTLGSRNDAVIKVTSLQPVTEPYLNFLVQALWPAGRLLKEYTVLLDPPTFADAASPTVSAPASTMAQAPAPARRAPSSTRTGEVRLDPSPAAAPTARRQLPQADGEHPMTTRDDTLWKIAKRTLPSDRVTVQQNMLAIQRMNPKAFIRNNINLLKAGYVLRLPSESEAMQISAGNAVAEVAQQAADWRAGRRSEPSRTAVASNQAADTDLRGQVDATVKPNAAPTSKPLKDGQLSIVAGAEGEGLASGAKAGGETAALAATMEENDRLARELDELNSKIGSQSELSENQLAIKDRQLEVKDQQLAQLEQQLAQTREDMKKLADRATLAPNQNQSARPAAPQPEWWMSPYVWGLSAVILVLILVLLMVVVRNRREREAELDAFLNSEPVVNGPQEPMMSVAPTADLENELDEPLVEDALAVDDLSDDDGDGVGVAAAAMTSGLLVTGADGDDDVDVDVDVDPDSQDLAEADDELRANDTGSHENAQAEMGDVLAEADIYIAYERYPQATNLLETALENEPERHDVRLKLLEVYTETGDKAGFDREVAELNSGTDDSEIVAAAAELANRFEEEAPIHLDDLDAAGDAPSDSVVVNINEQQSDEASVDDFELTLETDDLDADEMELDLDSAAGIDDGLDFELELDADLTETDVEEAADLEFDLELEDSEAVADLDDAAAEIETGKENKIEPKEGAGDQLGGDLGIDFDPEPVAADASGDALENAEPGDGDDFDFLDDADAATTKLDLARAYIDMGDSDGARDILNEVIGEGSNEQQKQAQELLEQI